MIHTDNFLTILVYAGALQGLILCIALIKVGIARNRSMLFLAQFLALISLTLMGRNIDPSVYVVWPKLLLVQDVILFLFGPMLLLFIKSYTMDYSAFQRKHLFHLLPWVLFVLAISPIVFSSEQEAKAMLLSNALWRFWLITAVCAISYNLIYVGYSYALVSSFGRDLDLKDGSKRALNSLKLILFLLSLCLLCWAYLVMSTYVDWVPEFAVMKYETLWILLSCFSYFLGYLVLTHPEFVQFDSSKLRKKDDEHEELSDVKNAIQQLFDLEKVFLDPSLSLVSLSDRLGLNKNLVSLVINRGFGCSFYELVNQYRVNEFKHEVLTDENRSPILDTAFKVGFNSKTTFNTAFKKSTGMTPSAYLKANS